ncbi:MAG: biotin/lipoyl-containing protein [Thermoplasmatota archaeon]
MSPQEEPAGLKMDTHLHLDGQSFQVRLTQTGPDAYEADVDGHTFPVTVDRDWRGGIVRADGHAWHVQASEDPAKVLVDGRCIPFLLEGLHGVAGATGEGAGSAGMIHPPMTGKVDAILVEAGQEVAAGDVLFILEAMKMRNEVKAPAAGRVVALHAAAGAAVEPGQAVLELEAI